MVKELSKGVGLDQVFEIENTIVKPQASVDNFSVVKIKNVGYNMYLSTEIKGLDGGEEEEGEGSQEDEEEALDVDEFGAEAGFVGENTGTNKTGTRNEATEGVSGLDVDLLDGQNVTGEGMTSPVAQRDGLGQTAENLDLNDRQSLQDKADMSPGAV